MGMYLGVDAGGTKTALCLVADRGEVRGRARAGSGYYLDAAGATSRQEGAEHPGVAAVAAVLASRLAGAGLDAASVARLAQELPAVDRRQALSRVR
ncbi:hypothetical protein ACUN7V_00875 [Quadrisphaera oryzae]|uniref:hypothetical protein n=1 Tax=Quadrisphaera TaxID=317661 RepID=UPI001644D3BA|nr:hypothetical protein [Quadrisphaera sp. RL12-1S]MBC3762584.1 hypothetical protein [Quadrisphaera sp. RL12-1S]